MDHDFVDDEEPKKWKLNVHAYVGSWGSPSEWTDVGHTFVTISEGDEIIAAGGLAPSDYDESDNSSKATQQFGTEMFARSSGITRKGGIFGEFSSLEAHKDKDLKTKSFDIDEEQARKAMDYMARQRHDRTSWNLYSDNCTQWAKSVTEHVGVDTGTFWHKGYTLSPQRPNLIMGKMQPGLGGLKLPPDHEMSKLKKTNKSLYTEKGMEHTTRWHKADIAKKKKLAQERSKQREHLKKDDHDKDLSEDKDSQTLEI